MSHSDPRSVVRAAIVRHNDLFFPGIRSDPLTQALVALNHKPVDQSTACKCCIADPHLHADTIAPNSLPARPPVPLSSRDQAQRQSPLANVCPRARKTTRDAQSPARCRPRMYASLLRLALHSHLSSALKTSHRRVPSSGEFRCAASQEKEQKESHQGPT